MSLHDPDSKPWFRKSLIERERREAVLLSEHSELLYFRFLSAFTEHRCRLPADAKLLARVLGSSPDKVKKFLSESAGFIWADDTGMLVHKASQDEFDKAVQTSLKQARRRIKEVPSANHG